MTVEITSSKHLCKACKQPKSCNCSDELELLLFKEKEPEPLPEPKEKKQNVSPLSLAFWSLIEMDYDNFSDRDQTQLRIAIYHIIDYILRVDRTYKAYFLHAFDVSFVYDTKSPYLKSIVLEYLDKWNERNE